MLESLLNQAKKASKEKTDFLSNLSHEIRTPMNSIINMTTIAKKDIMEKRINESLTDLNQIQLASNSLLELINDVLDISRIESGRLKMVPSVYELSDFFQYLRVLFTPLCKEKNIKMVFKVNKEPTIFIDKIRLNQIFVNLLSNAVKYTKHNGAISFVFEILEETPTFYQTRFIVKDNGIGMSEEFQKKMFEPFEREQSENDSLGTGLGLSIVKKLLDLMNAKITVDSLINSHTFITIELRLEKGFLEQKQESKIKNNKEKSLVGKKILVVEDNKMNMQMLNCLMDLEGIHMEKAWNGEEAIMKFKNHKEFYYDMILMDVRMPKKNGFEATKEIRNLLRKDAKRIPILAMTADAFQEDKQLSKEAGMNEHITKPINPKDFFDTIKEWI